MGAAYDAINRTFKSTCRVVFGKELGELTDYEGWLSEHTGSLREEKSASSGKKVCLGINDYCKGACFASFEELDFEKKFQPICLNEAKDIDSILGALKERLCYTGNVILGNSKFIEASANVIDSHYVFGSAIVSDSKHIAYSKFIRSSEYEFGTYGDGNSSHIMRCSDGYKNMRCFECHSCANLSDCYYCNRCQNCQNCMFCFGARNKQYAIGNQEMPKEKYLAIKARLLSEMALKLEKGKSIFSLFDIVQSCSDLPMETKLEGTGQKQEGKSTLPIEKAFSRTSSLLLGRELSGIDSYSKFLLKHVYVDMAAKSAFSNQQVLFTGYLAPIFKSYNVKDRAATEGELEKVGKLAIGTEKAESVSLDLGVLANVLNRVCFISLDNQVGENINLIDCSNYHYSESCYKASAVVYSKKCAYSWWARHSENMFGSCATWESSFCMRAFYSNRLTRAFEVDSCEKSSDIYFSHNCENMQDAMFCFNAKNLKRAIGNAPIEPSKYSQIKKSLLSQIAGELERKKDVSLDIYNIGCYR